jgi:triphosphatase
LARDACYSALHSEMGAQQLQRLLLRFAIWMHGAYWQQHAWIGLQVRDFASSYLSELASQFEQAGKHPESLDAATLHAMRIQAKKLRYCAEFFATLYGKQKSRQYLVALGKVQDVLGQVHDDAMAQSLLDELSAIPALTAHQDTIALSKGWIAHDLSDQLVLLNETMRNFQGQQKFWEK